MDVHLTIIKRIRLNILRYLPFLTTDDGCPSYLSSPQPPSRNPPSKRHINVKQRKEAEQQEWLKCDKIDSYERFSSDVKVHIQSSFPSVFVHQSEDHVLLYKLNHSDDTSRSVSVSLTIRIYKNMTLSVWINNTKLLQSTLDWILSHTKSSLQLWSQLHNIVSRYSIDTPDVDVTSSSKALTHNVESFGVTIQREEPCNFLAEQIRLLATTAIRDYLINFSDEKKQRCDINFIDSFPYNNNSKQNKIDDLSPLLLVSGYVAHKSILHNNIHYYIN